MRDFSCGFYDLTRSISLPHSHTNPVHQVLGINMCIIGVFLRQVHPLIPEFVAGRLVFSYRDRLIGNLVSFS